MSDFINFKFQSDAVDKVVSVFKKMVDMPVIEQKGVKVPRRIAFKAPTGAGKTVMMGQLFKKIVEEREQGWSPSADLLFVWISLNDLHVQSKRKIEKIVGNLYTIQTLDTLKTFDDKTLLFTNWQSLTRKKVNDLGQKEWANRAVINTERGDDIGSLVEGYKQSGKDLHVVVFVDESQNYLSKQSEEFIADKLKPSLIVEISATPRHIPTQDEIEDDLWGYIKVSFKDVVEAGLIKKQTHISPDIDKYNAEDKTDLEVLLEAAYYKQEHLKKLYKAEGTNINPAILIQLPSKSKNLSTSDKNVQEEVEKFFRDKDITRDNGKLAVWLSEDKENKDNVEDNDNEVEVLIFKVAIAQGTDIPRASILVMLREISSINLEIQTVGRILRMPEAKHYDNEELNIAYLYTSIDGIGIKDQEALEFFSMRTAHLKKEVGELFLPTEINQRLDRIQLDIGFEKILFKKLCQHFKIDFGIDDKQTIYNKVDKNPDNPSHEGLELYVEELTRKSKVGITVGNIDEIEKYIGTPPRTEIDLNSDMSLVKAQYYWIAKSMISPYLSGNGVNKLHNVFKRFFSLMGITEDFMQRIVALSLYNQTILRGIIDESKTEFLKEKLETTGGVKYSFGEGMFHMEKAINIPESYVENEEYKRYAYQPCLMPAKTYETEKGFEKDVLEKRQDIEWWYKNPSGGTNSLGMRYSYVKPRNDQDGVTGGYTEAIFRPDYIVKFNDETIGIYDTKSFGTKDSPETKAKAESLSKYVKMLELNNVKADGGIVDAGDKSYKVFRGEKYSSVTTNEGWKNFDERETTVTAGKEKETLEAFKELMKKQNKKEEKSKTLF